MPPGMLPRRSWTSGEIPARSGLNTSALWGWVEAGSRGRAVALLRVPAAAARPEAVRSAVLGRPEGHSANRDRAARRPQRLRRAARPGPGRPALSDPGRARDV